MNLGGTNVLLTGGSRGIGPYIARALLHRGANVTLAARSADDLERVKDSLGGNRVETVAADVTYPEGRAGMISAAEEAFGTVDVLVNNAAWEAVLAFAHQSDDDITKTVRLNLESPLLLTRLVLPGMLERRRGHVVNISSVAGKASVPWNTVYAATKHGLVGFSLSLRSELKGTGVGISVICPGYVREAGMYAKGRLAYMPPRSGTGTTPRDVAAAVVRSIERDLPEVVVSGFLPKLSDVTLAISPTLFDRAARRSGGWLPIKREAEARAKKLGLE